VTGSCVCGWWVPFQRKGGEEAEAQGRGGLLGTSSFCSGSLSWDATQGAGVRWARHTCLSMLTVASASGYLRAEPRCWVHATEDELVLRHCAYWKSLRGLGPTENTATIRVRFSRSDCFHVPQVSAMMSRIQDGAAP